MDERKAKICVPVCVRRAGELRNAIRRAGETGDVVEIRFDCVSSRELNKAMKEYARVRASLAKPVIVTFRPYEEGGNRNLRVAEQLEFWRQYWSVSKHDEQFAHDLADIEYQFLRDPVSEETLPSARLICSYHDLAGVPTDLGEVYERMAATNAAVVKIAVMATDATDCLPIFRLLERAHHEKRGLIAIAMGQAGVMTRILGPSRGSHLTYGSLDDHSATAAGQLTAAEQREVYRIESIDRHTEIMGVIGRPLAHSISPHIHNAALAAGNINGVFIPIEVHDLNAFMRRMVNESSREIDWKLRGLSVTAPHKSAVMQHLDWIEPAAKEIGAVNTIVIQEGVVQGYNTDAAGFVQPLKRRLAGLAKLRCAVMGAGGAARAVVWALRQERATVTVFARECQSAKGMTDEFEIECRSLANAAFDGFDVVVNATPLGTRGELENETPATARQLRGVRWAYDLVYNPLETRFMREASDAGCDTIGGLEMLVGQAVAQFRLWIGVEPSAETMERAAMVALRA